MIFRTIPDVENRAAAVRASGMAAARLSCSMTCATWRSCVRCCRASGAAAHHRDRTWRRWQTPRSWKCPVGCGTQLASWRWHRRAAPAAEATTAPLMQTVDTCRWRWKSSPGCWCGRPGNRWQRWPHVWLDATHRLDRLALKDMSDACGICGELAGAFLRVARSSLRRPAFPRAVALLPQWRQRPG